MLVLWNFEQLPLFVLKRTRILAIFDWYPWWFPIKILALYSKSSSLYIMYTRYSCFGLYICCNLFSFTLQQIFHKIEWMSTCSITGKREFKKCCPIEMNIMTKCFTIEENVSEFAIFNEWVEEKKKFQKVCSKQKDSCKNEQWQLCYDLYSMKFMSKWLRWSMMDVIPIGAIALSLKQKKIKALNRMSVYATNFKLIHSIRPNICFKCSRYI